jgi:predicted small lipoprotein YifL
MIPPQNLCRSALTLVGAAALAALAGCGESGPAPAADQNSPVAALADAADAAPAGASAASEPPPTPAGSSDAAMVSARLTAIEGAIAAWRHAPDVASAHRFAEAARNLVVGPGGPGYGDRDGDGVISGFSESGLLPGLGDETGVLRAGLNPCVERDLRGGDWAHPRDRWAELERTIAAWTPRNNPFPKLRSHPQRIVGWASLALDSTDLKQIHDYAGHAALHAEVSRRALDDCDED